MKYALVAIALVFAPAQVLLVDVPTAVASIEDIYAYEVGDDNGDGVIVEDESGWDCNTMGNGYCGL